MNVLFPEQEVRKAVLALGHGKRNLRMLPTRWPSLEVKLSTTRCGYASEMVPTFLFSPMSCRSTCAHHPCHGLGEANTLVSPGPTLLKRHFSTWNLGCWLAQWQTSAHGVVDAKVGGRAVGQVADDQAVGLASVLVHDNDVREVVAAAGVHQLLDDLQGSACQLNNCQLWMKHHRRLASSGLPGYSSP